MSTSPAPLSCEALGRAMRWLTALSEGFAGVNGVVALGQAAAPALRRLLFTFEPSGTFEPGCRAVVALAMLGRHADLLEFLSLRRAITDPAARAGEDAVINTAARA